MKTIYQFKTDQNPFFPDEGPLALSFTPGELSTGWKLTDPMFFEGTVDGFVDLGRNGYLQTQLTLPEKKDTLVCVQVRRYWDAGIFADGSPTVDIEGWEKTNNYQSEMSEAVTRNDGRFITDTHIFKGPGGNAVIKIVSPDTFTQTAYLDFVSVEVLESVPNPSLVELRRIVDYLAAEVDRLRTILDGLR